ncbi:hypothetical protein GALL_498340 [mine drainage metagenome]|uniref:Uncharacterized protein n=1 Tax=mine drainage metagenome TaxID=410659 RepID=A0A1J5PBJ4_9ZZZZ
MRCASTKANKDTGSTRAHQVKSRGVSGDTTNDDWYIEFINELFEVERSSPIADMFCAHCRATNYEKIDAGFHDRLVKLCGALRRESSSNCYPGGPDIGDPLPN